MEAQKLRLLDLPQELLAKILSQVSWLWSHAVCQVFRDSNLATLRRGSVTRASIMTTDFFDYDVARNVRRAFSQLPELTSLTVVGRNLDRLRYASPQVFFDAAVVPLAGFPHVQFLDIEVGYAGTGPVANISSIASCTGLVSLILNCRHCKCNVTDVNALAACAQLTSVQLLGFVHLSDIRGLSACCRLTSLTLDSCSTLPDLSPLTSCSHLSNVKLLAIKDLSGLRCLSACTALQSLSLDRSRTRNDAELHWIPGCFGLKDLSYEECSVRDERLPWLQSCTQLTSLSLKLCSRVFPGVLTTIVQLPNLEHFNCASTGLQDISRLGSMSSLRRLVLQGNRMPDVCPLAACTTLVHLDLSGCQSVSSVAPLAACGSLESLCLDHTSVGRLGSLQSCTRLERLFLGKCYNLLEVQLPQHPRLVEIQAEQCHRLRHVWLDGCCELGTVIVTDCGVESISVAGCARLRRLDVHGCGLLTMLDTSGCGHLTLRDTSGCVALRVV